MNATVHWAYRGQVLSLISNLQYHTDPAKKEFQKSEHVHFLNIFEPYQTMWGASKHFDGIEAPRRWSRSHEPTSIMANVQQKKIELGGHGYHTVFILV